MAIIFALISYVGWAVGDIFGTVASRKIGGYSTPFWYGVLQTVILGLLSPLFITELRNFTLSVFTSSILLGILGNIGLVAFYEGVRRGNAALVATIAGSAAAVAVVLSTVFLKETLSLSQLISIAIIFVGLFLSTFPFSELFKRQLKDHKGIILGFVAMVTWGIYQTFIKIPVGEIGWFWTGMFTTGTFPVILLFMKMQSQKLTSLTSKGAFLPLLATAVLLGGGTFSFYNAVDLGQIAVVAPIANSYPTLFAILAFLIFKDPITRQQIAGIVTTLAGIVLLSVFSV